MSHEHDPADVTGLEAVFESCQFGQRVQAVVASPGAAVRSTVEGIPVAPLAEDAPNNAPNAHDDTLMTLSTDAWSATDPDASGSAGGGAAESGERPVPSPTPPKRGSTTYRIIAAASCVAALVIAGVTSQTHRQRTPTVAALGRDAASGHGRGHGGNGSPTLGAPSTEAPASTGTSNDSRSASSPKHPEGSLSASTTGARGAPGAPGRHVTISGAATDDGTPPTGSTAPGSGGSAPQPPGPATAPTPPVATLVASTLNSVAASVSTATGQLASSVPGAAGAAPVADTVTNAVGAAVGNVSQGVGSTTS